MLNKVLIWGKSILSRNDRKRISFWKEISSGYLELKRGLRGCSILCEGESGSRRYEKVIEGLYCVEFYVGCGKEFGY